MASNFTGSSNATTENYPLPSQPLWIVPTDCISTSGKTVLSSNNDIELQAFKRSATRSRPNIVDIPPNYFDMSVVPNGAILYYNGVNPYTEASKAEIKRNEMGVHSFDVLIDKNPDQLWLYFMTYLNEKPQLKVNIRGYYDETYTTRETYRRANGKSGLRTVTKTRTVDEFSFSVDLSSYIGEQWWRVAVIPSATTGKTVTLKDALEQYTYSNNKFKKITLKKQIYGWNLAELQSKLTELVRSTGYRNCISITYKTFNYDIAAGSPSKLGRFANSCVVHVLCCISCLCLIFGPIYCCLRTAGSIRHYTVADYIMKKSADTFLHLNSQMIVNAIHQRSFETYTAHFA